MRIRIVTLAVAFALLGSSVALGQSDVLDLEMLWRRGQFDLARELINANVNSGNKTEGFLKPAAKCAEEMHDYELAAGLYEQLAHIYGSPTTEFRDYMYHSWANRWEANGQDPEAAWVDAARDLVAVYLDDTRLLATGIRRQNALELEYLLSSVLNGPTLPKEELRTGYPGSEVVLKAARSAADALATEPDHHRRLALADEFLTNYPGCHWRHYVWRYKLYTNWQLRRFKEMIDSAETYLAEYPESPLSLGAVSRYYFDADIHFDTGYEYALRSVELSETALGISGSGDSLQEFNADTEQLEPHHDYLPPGLREQFLQYLGARFNLARYLVVKGDYDLALEMVLPVINTSPYTTGEDLTLAPFLLIAGQAYEGLGQTTEAVVYFHTAAVTGDSRNRYAIQAAEHLSTLEETLGKDKTAVMTEAFNRAWTNGLATPLFTDVSGELGLSGAEGKRVAWADIDLDGDQDLLVDGTKLYRNDTDQEITGAGFTAVSRIWGLSTTKATSGVFADIDNDGDLDLYTTGNGRNGDRLWRNGIINRTGAPAMRFSDITSVAGAPTDNYPSEGACWTNINGDGHIDIYVANYEDASLGDGPLGVGTPDRVYLNQKGTYFTPLDTAAAGMVPPFGRNHASRGAVNACDFDNDGDQDVFVGNYRLQENLLWRCDGAGGFTNCARLMGVAGDSIEGWWGHTIGAAWGDVDNDGDFDLFTANLAHPRYAYSSDKSQLLINEHGLLGPTFSDRRGEWGIKYEETHACPVFLDANNDGHLDLYLTSMYDGRRSFLYVNGDPAGFRDLTWLSGSRVINGFGAAWADYDNDGDLDLAVGRLNGSVVLLRNDTPAGNSWLQVECRGGVEDGTGSNRAGIGTQVTLVLETGQARVAEIQSGSGTGCGNQLIAHFGLGDYDGHVELQARFPSGRYVFKSVRDLNQRVVLSESDAVPPQDPSADEGISDADAVLDANPETDPAAGDTEEAVGTDANSLDRSTGSRG